MRERYVGRHRESTVATPLPVRPLPRPARRPSQTGVGLLLAGACAAGFVVADATGPRVMLADQRAALPNLDARPAAGFSAAAGPGFDATAADREIAAGNAALGRRAVSAAAQRQAEQQQAVLAAQVAAAEQARLEAERQAAQDRAAREAQRQAILADAQRDPKSVARVLAAERGWTGGQFSCLVTLWEGESNWRWWIANPSSGAYGIPQALPGSKMASAGADWRTNPATQISWGLTYIKGSYGTPCNALAKWRARTPHWY